MQTHLPSGLPDVLPPVAAQEFRVIERLLHCFTSYGYQPVIPPIAEFEAHLLAGSGAATSNHMFRMMDIVSHQMLALRADITTQIGRIAAQGLKDAPRPLRLCYAGQTLRTTAEPLKTRRQHTQIGIELFGATAPSHDGEIVTIAIDALSSLSLTDLSLDLSAPSMLETLLLSLPTAQHAPIKAAVARKDSASLKSLGASLIAAIVEASGPARIALDALDALTPEHAGLTEPVAALKALCASLTQKGCTIPVTIDLLEMRGFGYYNGLAYSLYLRNPALEIGRGGHYLNQDGENAAGFTFYIDDVLAALPPVNTPSILAVATDTDIAMLHSYHAQGYRTVFLHSIDEAEAKRMGATHIVINNSISII